MEGNYYRHKVKWCPICSQGWVEIVKDMETVHCFAAVQNVNLNGMTLIA